MKELKELRQRLKENPLEGEKICNGAHLSKKNFRRKLYNPRKFTIFEILVIRSVMGLTMDETIKIFAPFVANYN